MHIHVHGSNNQIIGHAEQTAQHFAPAVSGGGDSPAAVESASPVSLSEYHLYVHHDAVNVPLLIRKAEKQIVFHAAFYPKYGLDDPGMILLDALKAKPGLKLRVIFTDPHDNPWLAEFAKILRPYYSKEDFVSALRLSHSAFEKMAQSLPAGQVSLVFTARMPLFPVILIDNTIIVGHYAHSETIAPHGLWLTIQNHKILEMYKASLCGGLDLSALTPEERAIFRYVEEFCLTSG